MSIITISYNSFQTIRDTIDSVLLQDYDDIEYIVIDGNSSDGTQDIVKSYGEKITKFVSEKDNGIYDAMNKGISLASGDIIGILNSDDLYPVSDVISRVIQSFRDDVVDSVYGDIEYVDRDNINKVQRVWRSRSFYKKNFFKGWMPPHPAFFVKREVYEKYGKFRTDMNISADYEIMLRFLFKNNISSKYIHKTMVRMRLGGISNINLKNVWKANKEVLRAWRVNGLRIPYYIFFLKPLSKLLQINFKKYV